MRALYVLIFLFVITSCFSQADNSKKVLFVGNSYTYFWNLPQVIEHLAESQDIPLIARQSTAGGAHLGHHWTGARDLDTYNLIKNGNWDYVVLQDHSLRTIEALDSLIKYVELWSDVIRESQAEPVLYMTWPRAFNPLMIEKISSGYREAGRGEGLIVVPVGETWSLARELRPEINIYDPDGSHPSPLGTYLTACVFFRALTGQSPSGLPARLTTTDRNGEKLYLMIVPPDDARFCHDVVESIFSNCLNCKIETD